MIDRMIERYNIDPAQSYMIGDSTVDIQTGINAGLHTVLVRTGQGGRDGKYHVKAEIEAQDLLDAVRTVFR
jgi:histidinol phosphatase-like enzyme